MPDQGKITHSRKPLLLALVLLVVTVGLYWPTTRQGFAVIDDDDYVTDNPWVNEGVSLEATRWAFTTYHAANWHPLTWLSHQADWSLHGAFAGGHHLTNVLLHAANVLLLFLLLRRLTGNTGCSWLVAAFFAWHPLRVESVAWIAERKDLLSTLCLLGSIWAYCRYAKGSTTDRASRKPIYFYCLALVIFAAGLMCKPMVVTLPCLLLLLDYWPLQRTPISAEGTAKKSWPRLLGEKIPFFALAVGGCLVTLAAQHAGGAVKSIQQVPLTLRCLNALGAYGQYLYETFWPAKLCVFYPMPEHYPVVEALVGALLLVGLTVLAVRCRKRCPWWVMGWLWFVGSLVPVIGLVTVGAQAHADRYTYIPSIGLYVGLVWGIHHLASLGLRNQKIAAGLAMAGLLACIAITRNQLGYWDDNIKLFSHALACARNNAFAQNNLGVAYSKAGQSPEAILHYREAIRLEPRVPRSYYNLGTELAKAGELEAAARAFSQALQYNPHNESLLNNLGVVLAQQGKYEAALGQFREAIASNPIYPKSYLNAGAAYQALGQAGPAVTNYNLALRLQPNSLEAMRHLAGLLATCPEPAFHQPEQAVRLATRTVELSGGQVVEFLQTLAMTYASAGQYSKAAAAAEQALRLAQQQQRTSAFITALQSELTAYRAGKNPMWDWKRPF